MKVMLLCGLPGSGKTTLSVSLAKEYSAVRFSIDEWMINLYDHEMNQGDFDNRMEKIKQTIWKTVEQLIVVEINVVLDYGFWQTDERIKAIQQIKKSGGVSVIYFFELPLAKLKDRLKKRNQSLSEDTFKITTEMLEEFIEMFELPTPEEGASIIKIS